jgi:carboxymethylenebutenolidase
MSQIVKLEADGSSMDAYVAMPAGKGNFPGVVVAHHQYGLSQFTHSVVDALAGLGCIAISVDHFHHSPPGDDMDAKKKILRDSRLANDIAAAIAFLEAQPNVDSSRLAVMGHCMGGRTTFLAASLFPIFKAASVYYSGGMFTSRGNEGPTAFDRLKDIKCPVIGSFGALDKNPSPDDVAKIDTELTRCRIDHQFRSYPGAGHGFCSADSPGQYNAEATADSWKRTVDLFTQRLGLPAKVAT